MRVATIDIGTNSVLLLVAEESSSGVRAVEQRSKVTRLGQGVDKTGELDDAAVVRTTDCLAEYAEVVRRCGVDGVGVVGTSALRDARGGERVSSFVQSHFGARLRVISGMEEARLTFLGALSGLSPGDGNGVRCAFDVGGGSTEVVVGSRAADGGVRVDRVESFNVGSVRMTERFVRTDPPTRRELEEIVEVLDETFAGLSSLPSDAPPIGIAGTVTTLASISLQMKDYDGERVHGYMLDRAGIEGIVHRLASMSARGRGEVVGLDPGRGDVIVAGGLVVTALMRRLGASTLRVSDRGIRWGLAEEMLGGVLPARPM